jgi:hypothetical protein
MYLTFEEYQAMGGELDKLDFEDAEFTARSKINNMTFNRITETTESVKRCVFGLIRRGYLGDLNGEDYISMGSGRRSATKESKKGKAEAFIRDSLSDSPNLFYAGF